MNLSSRSDRIGLLLIFILFNFKSQTVRLRIKTSSTNNENTQRVIMNWLIEKWKVFSTLEYFRNKNIDWSNWVHRRMYTYSMCCEVCNDKFAQTKQMRIHWENFQMSMHKNTSTHAPMTMQWQYYGNCINRPSHMLSSRTIILCELHNSDQFFFLAFCVVPPFQWFSGRNTKKKLKNKKQLCSHANRITDVIKWMFIRSIDWFKLIHETEKNIRCKSDLWNLSRIHRMQANQNRGSARCACMQRVCIGARQCGYY